MSKWRGVLVGGGFLIAIAGAGIWLAPAALVSGAGTAEIAVQPASKNVPNDGNTFTVDVKVSDVNNLGAFDFTISFDNSVLEYTGLTDSGFLSSTGRQATCIRPAAGPNGESREQIANQYGALHFGCTTNGLITGGDKDKPGPNGSATIATLSFKPKSVGLADVQFEGLTEPFKIGDPANPADVGFTGLGAVEVCPGGDCAGINIDTETQNGVIQVTDPNAPQPTGVPPTPTKEPKTSRPLTQATVDAALGVTPRAGGPGATSGTPTSGNGPTGTIGGNSSSRGTGTLGARGANGAPVAGYGPQERDEPGWPRVVGLTMGVCGLLAAASGYGIRRKAS